MKNKLLIRVFFCLSAFVICCSISFPFDAGAPNGFCNAPANNGFTCKSCHSGPVPIFLPGMISSNIPASGYVPGNTYTVTASIVRPGHIKFGFEVSPQDSSGVMLGTMAILDTTAQLVGSSNDYITHTSAGTGGAGNKSWSFSWTAPASGTGSVPFYGACLAANANGQSSGDTVFLSTLLVNESGNGISYYGSGFFKPAIYPNPAAAFVTIEGAGKSDSVHYSICNMSGVEVKSGNIFSQGSTYNSKISVSDISKGLYFVRVTDGKTSFTQKLNKK